MSDEPSPPPVLPVAATFYVLLSGAALAIVWLRTGEPLPESLAGGRQFAGLLYGAGLGLAVAGLSRLLLERLPWFRWFAGELRRFLGPIDARTALWLAVLSGFGEELFFRGALQPAIGYAPASLVFGLVHVGPDRRYFAWTLFAVAMGFALGGILEATGSLAGPILAHALVNYLNLRRLGRVADEPVR